MPGPDQFWFHAGISKATKDSGTDNGSWRVRIPDRLFREEDILELEKYINWYYNEVTGVLIITHDHLEKDDYEYTGEATKFSEGDSEYKCTVPKIFFPGSEGVRGTEVQPEIGEKVQLQENSILHFVYNKDMIEEKPKSSYVLTESQFDKRFSDSDHWDGELDQAPKFFG